MAGSTPVAGALVQIYAAGLAGNGSAPTQLLSAAVTTDTSGAFNVAAGSYSCPGIFAMVYAVAVGGQVGSQAANSGSELSSVLGFCEYLSQSTYVVNEATTVATAFAMRPYLAPGAQMGASPSYGFNFLARFTFNDLVDPSSGTVPGHSVPSSGAAPTAKLDTLANLLHGCIVATSTAAACTQLFSLTTANGVTPNNTLDAVLAIANQPGTNVASLYALARQVQVFQPALPTSPLDWTLAFAYTGGGMNGPTAVSVTNGGDIWVANYYGVASLFGNNGAPIFASGVTGNGLHEVYGAAVDAGDQLWLADEESADGTTNGGHGTISILSNDQQHLPSGTVISSGGLNFPTAVAFSRTGRTAWVVDYGDGSVSLFDAFGTPLSGANGYTSSLFAFPVAVAVDSTGAGWVANSGSGTLTRVAADGTSFINFTVGDGPAAVAVDAHDNIWSANYRANSLGLISPGGQILSNSGFTGGGLNHPTGLAVDGSGTVFVANYRGPGISVFAGAQTTVPGAALSNAPGWGADAKLLEAFGIAVDGGGSVWVSSSGDNRLLKFVGVAAPVTTPLLGGVQTP